MATSEELRKLGFSIETLPSGRVNLSNPTQFKINGIIAYLQTKGQYQRTIESLAYIKKIELV
jgi:hypothetical protein